MILQRMTSAGSAEIDFLPLVFNHTFTQYCIEYFSLLTDYLVVL